MLTANTLLSAYHRNICDGRDLLADDLKKRVTIYDTGYILQTVTVSTRFVCALCLFRGLCCVADVLQVRFLRVGRGGSPGATFH